MSDTDTIFLFMDHLRHDMLGCYGNETVLTPNIDRLAETGVRFANCYSQHPICLPERASIVTGRYPHNHHVHCNRPDTLGPDEVCFPALLRESGVQTAVIGKLHLYEYYEHNCRTDIGFRYEEILEGKSSLINRVPVSQPYYDFLNTRGLPMPEVIKDAPDFERNFKSAVSPFPEDAYIEAYLTDRAMRFIDETSVAPYFLWLGYFSPHTPYDPPREVLELYADLDVPVPTFDPVEVEEKCPGFRAFQKRCEQGHDLRWNEETMERLRIYRTHYLATITAVDRQIGRLVEFLDRTGRLARTNLIIAADHGEFLGDHGAVMKNHFLYDCNVHTPLIMNGPCTRGMEGTVESLVETLDISRTVLDLAGIDEHPRAFGKSLLPVITDKTSPHRRAAFAESYHRKMVRKGKYKLIHEPGFDELYDLDSDPLEKRNLAGDPALANVVSDLKSELVDWLARTEEKDWSIRPEAGGNDPSTGEAVRFVAAPDLEERESE